MVYLQYVCIINNGRIIALLREEGQFLSVPEHAGLMICCDGVPVFKSSGWCDDFMHCWFIPGQTLWPFLVITTSLPNGYRKHHGCCTVAWAMQATYGHSLSINIVNSLGIINQRY